jgi:glycine dehydrogenase
MGEAISKEDVGSLLDAFGASADLESVAAQTPSSLPQALQRTTPFLTHPVFNSHQSETLMLRSAARPPSLLRCRISAG